MRACWIALASGLAATATPGSACVYSPPLDLNDVRHADIVVVGRIVNYRIVRDEEARRDRRVLQARWPHLSLREQLRRARRSDDFLSDHASFEVVVERVLAGQAEGVLTVRWQNSTFGEPRSLPGERYLVALRRPANLAPTDPRTGAMIPVQSSCSTAFIFEETSREAGGVRAILERR